MLVCSDISLLVVTRSSTFKSWSLLWPVTLAKVFSSSRDTFRKFPTRFVAASSLNLARSWGSCVAIPTGQIPVPQILYCWQAAAIRGAVATVIKSMFYCENYHNFACLKVAALFLIYICLNGIAQTTCSYNLNIRTAVFNLDVTLRDYYCLIS